MTDTVNTLFIPLLEGNASGLLYIAPSLHEATKSCHYTLVINKIDFADFLHYIRDICRKETLSFCLNNNSRSIKKLSILSSKTDDILTFTIRLASANKESLSQDEIKAWLDKEKPSYLLEKIRNIRLPRSRLYSLIGPDGVGKSTVASFIKETTPSKMFRYKSVYRKSLIYKILFSLQKKQYQDKNSYDDVHPNVIFFTSLLRLHIKSLLSLFSKKTILSDRYTNDHLAYQLRANEAPKISSWFKLKAIITPAPKNIIQLDAPAYVITARRAELSEQTIDFLSSFYLNSALLIQPANYIYLNTHTTMEETRLLVNKLFS